MSTRDLPLPADLAALFSSTPSAAVPTTPMVPPMSSTREAWALVPTRVMVPVQAYGASPPAVSLPADLAPPPPAPPVSAQRRVFARIGVMRDICLGERRWVVRERKGYGYIETLLVRPTQALLATSLQAASDGQDARIFTGSCGPVLSIDALQQSRERADDLREELAEARATGDAAGEERIRAEMSALAASITGATDRRGRPRQLRDQDRIRIAVTNAIRRGIGSIGQVAPEVATYLSATISTGTWLVYRPLAAERWDIASAA